MMAIKQSDRDRAGKAIYELLKIEVLRGNLIEAQKMANILRRNLRINNLTTELILDEVAYSDIGVSTHAFQKPRFWGLMQLARLASGIKDEVLTDIATTDLFQFIQSHNHESEVQSSLSYSEAGKQLALIGLLEESRIFLKKRVEICRREFIVSKNNKYASLVGQSLFELYFTYSQGSLSNEPNKIFDEIYALVEAYPDSFSGSGPVTINLHRLFSERGIKWPL